MPVTATIRSLTRVGSGVSVAVEYSDGSNQSFEFTQVPAGSDIRQAVRAEVNARNQIETQVNRLQNLVGVVID